MNDATTAMITGLAGKGANAILGSVGGTAAKMLLNIIFEGTTDPTAAALNKINEQLLEIKGQIKELPDAVAIYQAYNQAILDAQLIVAQFKDVLHFTTRRKTLFKTHESYLATLTEEQWKTMDSFLTPGVKDNANAHINNILKAAYGLDKQDVTETDWEEIGFGDSQRSYARLRSKADLQKLPGNFQEYVSNQVFIRNTVMKAISGIVAAVQSIVHAYKAVDIEALPAKTRKRIQERLANVEFRDAYLVMDAELKVPQLHADLMTQLLFAPAYLCGNAFGIYNSILEGKAFTYKNLSTKEYVALDDKHTITQTLSSTKTHSFKQHDAKGNLEQVKSYWQTKFASKGTAWTTAFVDKKPGVVSLRAPEMGYLFIYGVYDIPGVTTKGLLVNNDFCYWQLGMVPLQDSAKGHKVFCFTLNNVEKDRALVNESPFMKKDRLGWWKLDHFDGNHQWDIQLVSTT